MKLLGSGRSSRVQRWSLIANGCGASAGRACATGICGPLDPWRNVVHHVRGAKIAAVVGRDMILVLLLGPSSAIAETGSSVDIERASVVRGGAVSPLEWAASGL